MIEAVIATTSAHCAPAATVARRARPNTSRGSYSPPRWYSLREEEGDPSAQSPTGGIPRRPSPLQASPNPASSAGSTSRGSTRTRKWYLAWPLGAWVGLTQEGKTDPPFRPASNSPGRSHIGQSLCRVWRVATIGWPGPTQIPGRPVTDRDTLYATVLADPADDTARLVLADLLRESDDPDAQARGRFLWAGVTAAQFRDHELIDDPLYYTDLRELAGVAAERPTRPCGYRRLGPGPQPADPSDWAWDCTLDRVTVRIGRWRERSLGLAG